MGHSGPEWHVSRLSGKHHVFGRLNICVSFLFSWTLQLVIPSLTTAVTAYLRAISLGCHCEDSAAGRQLEMKEHRPYFLAVLKLLSFIVSVHLMYPIVSPCQSLMYSVFTLYISATDTSQMLIWTLLLTTDRQQKNSYSNTSEEP